MGVEGRDPNEDRRPILRADSAQNIECGEVDDDEQAGDDQ